MNWRKKVTLSILALYVLAVFTSRYADSDDSNDSKRITNDKACQPGEYIVEYTETGPKLLCFRSDNTDRK